MDKFCKFRPLWYSLQLCTVHVASTDLSFIQDSQILRHTNQKLKRGWWICQNQIKIWQPPTYLASILSKPHVIYYTKQPFYKPVLHYISVTFHILWHYISVTYIFDLFFITILVGHPEQEFLNFKFLIVSFEWWSSVFVIDSW